MRRAAFVVASAVLLAAFVLVPLPYIELEPGKALVVEERLSLDTSTDELDGSLLLTTVHLSDVTSAELVGSWFDDQDQIRSRERYLPPDVDADRYRRQQLRVFEESVDIAAAVAERAAGLEVRVSGDGAVVVDILPGAPAEGQLQTGDVITAVDGQPVELANDVGVAIGEATAGEVVHLEVRRDSQPRDVEVELEQISELGQAGIGIVLQSVGPMIDLPVPVELTEDGIGGPSAGLMVALTIYDLLDDGDLLAGRTVAGTGTIDAEGTVGPVGGVELKVVAAEDAGASIFLAPDSLAADARAAAPAGLEIIAVGSFEDAVDALSA